MSSNVVRIEQVRSKRLVEDGKFFISNGNLDLALKTFQKSIEFEPSAEAYTYLGWIHSLNGNLEEAIDLCLKAVKLDPTFGNPYNDIGSYLIQKGYLDDAIPWLERAKASENYEPRHFPHINLGRIYSAQGKIEEALTEFQTALQLVPDHEEIQNVIDQLENLRRSEN